jgi:hypothetical protein
VVFGLRLQPTGDTNRRSRRATEPSVPASTPPRGCPKPLASAFDWSRR